MRKLIQTSNATMHLLFLWKYIIRYFYPCLPDLKKGVLSGTSQTFLSLVILNHFFLKHDKEVVLSHVTELHERLSGLGEVLETVEYDSLTPEGLLTEYKEVIPRVWELRKQLRKHMRRLNSKIYTLGFDLEPLSIDTDALYKEDADYLQMLVVDMLKQKDERAVTLFLGQKFYFTTHLDVLNSRPKVNIIVKNSFGLPNEIMTMVCEYLSLEDLVSLRQVNTYCYSLFQFVNIKSHVVQRNPWLLPRGEIATWSDCALITVSRKLKKIQMKQYSVLATPVKTLPNNFIKLSRDEKLPPRNLYTECTSCDVFVTAYGCKMIVPECILEEDPDEEIDVELIGQFVVQRSSSWFCYFRRKYDNQYYSIPIDSTSRVKEYPVGDYLFVILSSSTHERRIYMFDSYSEYRYKLPFLERKTPIAVYEGRIYWKNERGKITGSSIDLSKKELEVDRSFEGDSRDLEYKQCENAPWLLKSSRYVFDLRTGIKTKMEVTRGTRELVLGYVGGRFMARSYNWE